MASKLVVALKRLLGRTLATNEKRLLENYKQAYLIMREATYQSHNGHWDSTMQHGAGCPECIRARGLRAKADKILGNAAKVSA